MKKRKFLKLPEYPGGKEEFKNYIREHIRYPEEDVQQKIEGTVHLSADIDDNGRVFNISIEKGLGHGCDEEAIRLINNLHYGSVSNRGVRLKTMKRFRIQFKLDKKTSAVNPSTATEIQYNYQEKKKTDPPKTSSVVYSYTIRKST